MKLRRRSAEVARGLAANSSGPALELTDITKSYPGTPPVHALRGVSLAVDAGELVGIVGPSGSGKSTLLHVMGTLDRPTTGEVRIAGHPTASLSERRISGIRSHLIGFVFQQFFLMPGMSVLDNVAAGLLYNGISPQERLVRSAEALMRVGLAHRLQHHENELSGGERQRVAIARALVNDPAIVLADEPTGNLDTQTSQSIMDLLNEINDAGSTIVVITHDVELAESLPRRVRLQDGLVVSDTRTEGDQ